MLPFYKESHGKEMGQWVQVTPGKTLVGHKRKTFCNEGNHPLEYSPQGSGGFPELDTSRIHLDRVLD